MMNRPKYHSELELTEQFQTKDALIKRLKETLNDTIDLLNIREKQVNDLLDENKQANEDAEELYKWLSHVVDTYDSTGWTVPESWRTALKAHEERIGGDYDWKNPNDNPYILDADEINKMEKG